MNHRLAEEVGHVFTAVGRDTPPLVQRRWTKRWGGEGKENRISAYKTWRELSLQNQAWGGRQRRRRNNSNLHDA